MVLRIITSGFLASVLLLASCGSSSEKVEETMSDENKPFSIDDAKAVFTMRCASCHGDDGKLGMSGAKDLSVSKLSDKEILENVMNGKNAMPAFKEIIPNEQHEQILIYIKSLRK